MKKLMLLILLTIVSITLQAQKKQVPYPHLSPLQTIESRIGIIDVKLVYSRPSMRGRKIFGDLVPYGKIWRTGANKNTKIVFEDKVMIGNYELEAGTYSLFTKPNIDEWEIYFHTELDEYGVAETLDPKNILAKITVPIIPLNKTQETLSITFDNLTLNSAVLAIIWENTYVPIPINISVANVIDEKIKKERMILSSDYSAAAFILFEKEQLSSEALQAINWAISLLENGKSFEEWFKTADLNDFHLPNNYRLKSEIHAELGEMDNAIKYAELSLKIARAIKNEFYINENLKNLEKWKN